MKIDEYEQGQGMVCFDGMSLWTVAPLGVRRAWIAKSSPNSSHMLPVNAMLRLW